MGGNDAISERGEGGGVRSGTYSGAGERGGTPVTVELFTSLFFDSFVEERRRGIRGD